VLERIAYASQELRSFAAAHKMLARNMPLKITPRRVWEQAERVGADLVRRRNAEVMEMLQGRGPKGPANPPDLLVISVDGGRLQNRAREAGRRWCEYKAGVIYRATREEDACDGTRPDPAPEPYWRFKTTLGARDKPGKKTYEGPKPEVKTFAASTEKIDRFPLYVELEARRRGLMEAREVAFIGDGGSFVWRTSLEVCEDRKACGKTVHEILDIIHANSHLVAAAKAAYGPSSRNGVKWLNARLRELWAGRAEKLIAALGRKARKLGPRPERGEAREDTGGEPLGDDEAGLPPAVILWRCRDYFETNRRRIRYDEFRRRGLPLASSHVESAIEQTNERVKAAKKSWFLDHAEEMLALRTQALSEDGRWDDYFDKLREGEVEIPTRNRMKPIPVIGSERTSMAPAA
jgi:hypothetical protein